MDNQEVSTGPSAWTRAKGVVKLVYTNAAYWLVGLAPEEYHVMIANAWVDLGRYDRALTHFKTALAEEETGYHQGAVAFCYHHLGEYAAALRHYGRAYKLTKRPDYGVGLAQMAWAAGNIDECRRVLKEIRHSTDQLNPDLREIVSSLESAVVETEADGGNGA